jgi:hypothetical protein
MSKTGKSMNRKLYVCVWDKISEKSQKGQRELVTNDSVGGSVRLWVDVKVILQKNV